MKFEYTHGLPKEEARERLQALSEYLGNKYGLRPTWSGDSASLKGRYLVMHIDATLELGEGVVRVKGKDPGMLLRKKTVKYLTRKLDEYLDRGTSLDALSRGA